MSAVAFVGGFGAGLFEAVSQHGFGVLSGPTIRKHLFESGIAGVQSHQKFSNICPRFDPVSFRAGQDRVQDGRSRSCILAAEKEPILASDCLMA